jgi:hypothetical protein
VALATAPERSRALRDASGGLALAAQRLALRWARWRLPRRRRRW